jgi:hypothetical protein
LKLRFGEIEADNRQFFENCFVISTEYPPDMSQQLLLAACEQAERSEPAVRAAALMHIARVLARSDQDAAEELLERGITLAKELDGQTASLLLGNAICLAAAVSARHALPLYADQRSIDPFGARRFGAHLIALVNTMAQHGHIDDAIAYLNDPLPGDRFPLHFVNNLARECRDDKTRLKLLELSIREWRNPAPRSPGPEERFTGSSFAGFFGRDWNLLPREVATPVLRELVHWALDVKSEPHRFPLTDDPADPDLASENERLLFALMPALLHLEPDLAHSVLETHPQLAAAVKRFPLGMQSVWEEQRKYDPACDDVMTIGDSEIMSMTEAIATNFEEAFRSAHRSFVEDSDAENPNQAPKECWPSAQQFRNILFKAGQHQGLAAEKHLDRIPDPDLRLFAQIELCAAIAGLPQIGGLITQQSRKRQSSKWTPSPAELDQVFGAPMPGIRCPKCKWTPRKKNRWSCKCGHPWNTFDTRGLCPGCGFQWEITACLQCGHLSPHKEWYAVADPEPRA